jgi:hypothetical protein
MSLSAIVILMGTATSRPPPSSRVAARVRIKPAYQGEVETLFSEARLSPIYKEMRADGNVSYWFSKGQENALSSVLERMPLEYWAHYAVAGFPPNTDG